MWVGEFSKYRVALRCWPVHAIGIVRKRSRVMLEFMQRKVGKATGSVTVPDSVTMVNDI
jgi:hypothetical protein